MIYKSVSFRLEFFLLFFRAFFCGKVRITKMMSHHLKDLHQPNTNFQPNTTVGHTSSRRGGVGELKVQSTNNHRAIVSMVIYDPICNPNFEGRIQLGQESRLRYDYSTKDTKTQIDTKFERFPHVLMVTNWKYNCSSLVFGKIKPGESPLMCANREFLEETGIPNEILSFNQEDQVQYFHNDTLIMFVKRVASVNELNILTRFSVNRDLENLGLTVVPICYEFNEFSRFKLERFPLYLMSGSFRGKLGDGCFELLAGLYCSRCLSLQEIRTLIGMATSNLEMVTTDTKQSFWYHVEAKKHFLDILFMQISQCEPPKQPESNIISIQPNQWLNLVEQNWNELVNSIIEKKRQEKTEFDLLRQLTSDGNESVLSLEQLNIIDSTVFAASGDNGSGDGGSGNNVDFPASSPFVWGCGGTSLVTSGNVQTAEYVWNNNSSSSAIDGDITGESKQ